MYRGRKCSPSASVGVAVGQLALHDVVLAIGVTQFLDIEVVQGHLLVARLWPRLVQKCELESITINLISMKRLSQQSRKLSTR